jgi:UDP-glucose 4-epimerase
MRVLVAGAAGFIGSWTVQDLLESGHEVVALDNFKSGRKENLSSVANQIEILDVDIRDTDSIRKISGPLDVIVHLAFPTPLCDRNFDRQFYDVASTGTANLLELSHIHDAYFVYGSSISVYGRQIDLPISETNNASPMLVYGANKLHGELLCSAFSQINGLSWSALRISDTYGPRDTRINAINNFLAAARENKAIHIKGTGAQYRSFSYVADIARAITMAAEKRLENEIVNVSTDQAVSILELAEMISEEFAPDLTIELDSGKLDARDYVFSNSKFSRLIGPIDWTPLRDGLKLTQSM